MSDPRDQRIERLEHELEAARRTIDALVRRAERDARGHPTDEAVVKRTLNSLEEAIHLRNRALELSELHFRTVWEKCPDMLVLVDSDGLVLDANRAALDAGLRGRLRQAFADPDALDLALQGQPPDLTLKDGRSVHITHAEIDSGRRMVVIRDLSVYEMLETELQGARRMAMIGELAGAVSHEINNPLAVILGRLELLEALGAASEPELLERHLEVIADHARRVEMFVGNLDLIAQKGPIEWSENKVVDLVDHAVEKCGRRLERVHVSVDIEPRSLQVPGDRAQLQQVVCALLLNAADAMVRRGHIAIAGRVDRRYLRLDVRDHGAGARAPRRAAEERWQISTEGRRGTALGLNVAATIVRGHGGRLSMLEDSARGATWRVELPLGEEESGVTKRTLAVLMVDPRADDASEVAGMLRDAGHTVTFRTTLAQALEAVDESPPDVVLCARYLPGLGGRDVRDVLDGASRGLRLRVVLLLSGSHPAPREGAFVRTPVSAVDLEEALAIASA
ncbi:MAG: hypothetical protein GY913_01450 [Proteobacteria bacterium]|nr:hypothetical protein [Pseudomonadota bacterium]MCP4915564.1 hypothetical protein [Pseudomonadota bacterium]